MKDKIRVFAGGSFLSGIFISVGAIAFLKVGGILGACLFTFGLISIIHYQLKLYTGVSGFVSNVDDCITLPIILLFNIIGCAVLAYFAKSFMPDQMATAKNIVQSRLSQGGFNVFLLATLCGFIMTTVVKFAREGKWLPLLFGIPLFIMCGFVHSIADAFYYSFGLDGSADFTGNVIGIYLISVLGNFFGCNLYRIIMWIK